MNITLAVSTGPGQGPTRNNEGKNEAIRKRQTVKDIKGGGGGGGVEF